MSARKTGILLRGQDGHKYFIPTKQLRKYEVKGKTVHQEHINSHAPHVEAWAAEQGNGGQGPVMAMMAS